MRGIHIYLLLIIALLNVFAIDITADTDIDKDANAKNIDSDKNRWSWDRILLSRVPIIANGNIWPPLDESASDCLILVTHNQLMWHCPSGNETFYERTTLYRVDKGKFRGAFLGLGANDKEGKGRRMWLLKSFLKDSTYSHDELLELDTVTGKILQSLLIEDSIDGHDLVRIENRAFIAETRHGNIIEIAIPPSSPPYYGSSIEAGAEEIEKEGYVNIIKRHAGFTRADHLNNVAIHPDLLITNLHGKDGMKPKVKKGVTSPARLSALDRNLPEAEGRELTLKQDGFEPIQNVGSWCHGIAFWEDFDTGQIKLISLDSKSGTLVSVALTGPNYGHREVLWNPDENHRVLKPPDGVFRAYNNGAKVFSKGLAVQGGVAYFGVSYARSPPLRQTVPESLLVAIDLKTKKEIFVRTILSNGLINQILTRSYLGDVKLPEEISAVELTQHDGGGTLVDYCEDIEEITCKPAYDNPTICRTTTAATLCCACKGGNRTKKPHLAGRLGKESMKIKDNINATVTFIPHHNCRDKNGQTKRLPLEMKTKDNLRLIKSINGDLDYIVKYLCNVNVEPIQTLVNELGDEGFTDEYQISKDNAIIAHRSILDQFKPGCTVITFVFSSKKADKVYHFPWLNKWLPMLQELVLGPLGIPLNQILRMQLANMPNGSDIRFHRDLNRWVQSAHRTHVPITTHSDVFFLGELMHQKHENNAVLRIKSNAGEVYEFNNAKGHAVRNIGPSRVHLIIDWVEEPIYNEEKNDVEALVKLRPREVCTHPKGVSEMVCDGFEVNEKSEQEEKEDGEKDEL